MLLKKETRNLVKKQRFLINIDLSSDHLAWITYYTMDDRHNEMLDKNLYPVQFHSNFKAAFSFFAW